MENDIKTLAEDIEQIKKTQNLILELYNNINQVLIQSKITNETILCLIAHIYGFDKKPTYEIVKYLRDCGFTVMQISTFLNCTTSNIYSIIKKGGNKNAND